MAAGRMYFRKADGWFAVADGGGDESCAAPNECEKAFTAMSSCESLPVGAAHKYVWPSEETRSQTAPDGARSRALGPAIGSQEARSMDSFTYSRQNMHGSVCARRRRAR